MQAPGSPQATGRDARAPRARRLCAFGLVLAVAGVALSACAGGSGGSAAPTTSSTSTPTPTRTSTTATAPPTSTTVPPTTTTSEGGTSCATPARWSATRVVNQLLMVIGEFTAAGTLAAEAEADVGGFVFLGQPAASARPVLQAALTRLDADATGAGQVQPWMSTDTEGGPVSRLANVLGAIPSAREMAAEWSPAQVEQTMKARGEALRQLGITMDLAPVLDTASPTDPVAYESQRSFSATPEVVASFGAAYAEGLGQAGVVAVGKHFPGLGHASADTDTGPATDPPLSALRGDDLIPFRHVVASGIPVVMVGHPIVPGLTNGLPASLSPATYRLLRSTLHFRGVTMTDSLAAGAISAAGYSEAKAAVTAVRAGVDMPMVDASTWQAVVNALVSALADREIPRAQADASVSRILAAKRVRTCSS